MNTKHLTILVIITLTVSITTGCLDTFNQTNDSPPESPIKSNDTYTSGFTEKTTQVLMNITYNATKKFVKEMKPIIKTEGEKFFNQLLQNSIEMLRNTSTSKKGMVVNDSG